MSKLFHVIVIVILCVAPVLAQTAAQTPAPSPLDDPAHTFHDALLDNMAGPWKLTGTIGKRPANHTVDAKWILNHQFLQIHEKDAAESNDGNSAYEAMVMIGYDNTSERYVAHWIDIFGGRFSETLGYGTRTGDAIAFIFVYPDGPFRTTFEWQPEQKQWQWRMRQKNASGQWQDFANLTLTRAAN